MPTTTLTGRVYVEDPSIALSALRSNLQQACRDLATLGVYTWAASADSSGPLLIWNADKTDHTDPSNLIVHRTAYVLVGVVPTLAIPIDWLSLLADFSKGFTLIDGADPLIYGVQLSDISTLWDSLITGLRLALYANGITGTRTAMSDYSNTSSDGRVYELVHTDLLTDLLRAFAALEQLSVMNVDYLVTPGDLVPLMTSDSGPGAVLTVSSETSGHEGFQATDDTPGSSWIPTGTGDGATWQITFPHPQMPVQWAVTVDFVGGGFNPVVPAMTDDSDPVPFATNWTSAFGTHSAYHAFDQGPKTLDAPDNSWEVITPGTSQWIEIDLDAAYTVIRYTMTSANDSSNVGAPNGWYLSGSNDGFSTETVLDTQAGITDWAESPNVTKTFTFSNTTAYNAYRWYFTGTNPDLYLKIGELQLYTAGGGGAEAWSFDLQYLRPGVGWTTVDTIAPGSGGWTASHRQRQSWNPALVGIGNQVRDWRILCHAPGGTLAVDEIELGWTGIP